MSVQWYAGQVITADRLNAGRTMLVTQMTDQTVTSSTTYVESEVRFTPEPSATYAYQLLIAYSAGTTGDFKWCWPAQASVDVLFSSFTQAYALGAGSGFNTGSDVIFRRPGNSTDRVAGGGGTEVFLSAYDFGTFETGPAPSEVALLFAQEASNAEATILRGGNQTRFIYWRIA